ncbi:hypothetical protein ACFWHR_04225 [Leucobacter sp. NPDC058333]|uniref:hypothetical protein n=1 Tax=Leucobacter sp. NPDC058333 TaxID=3346450 RepID=UPI0036504D54
MNAAWVEGFAEGTVYGSLYAVAPAERDAAADRFVATGLPIHIDVILDRDASGTGPALSGSLVHRGIDPDALLRLGERHPDSLLEVHLIVIGGAGGAAAAAETVLRDEVARVLSIAGRIGVQRVALPAHLAADTSLTDEFRADGGDVWAVVEPDDALHELDALSAPSGSGAITGALVMLIEPGTSQAARPELLDRVAELAELAPALHVSVDGGVDVAIATRAIELGVHHVIVGRALFPGLADGETAQPEIARFEYARSE